MGFYLVGLVVEFRLLERKEILFFLGREGKFFLLGVLGFEKFFRESSWILGVCLFVRLCVGDGVFFFSSVFCIFWFSFSFVFFFGYC